jgi:hypothetical protein
MRPTPYFIGQALFLVAFAALFDRMSNLMILGLAAIQFVLVAGRLWDARRTVGLAFAPPILTVACWLLGMAWAVTISGDADGAELMVLLLTALVCAVSYVAVGVAAGCFALRRASVILHRPAAHAWAPPWQVGRP